MHSQTSNRSDRTQKTNANDCEFEIRSIPLPPEKRVEWEAAMKILYELIIEVLNEQEPYQIEIPSDIDAAA